MARRRSHVTGDELRQRFETLETEVLRWPTPRPPTRSGGADDAGGGPFAPPGCWRWRCCGGHGRRHRPVVGAVRPPPGRAGAIHPAGPGTLDHRPARLLHGPADQRGTGAEHHPNGHRRRGGADRGAPVDGLGGPPSAPPRGTHWPRCRTGWEHPGSGAPGPARRRPSGPAPGRSGRPAGAGCTCCSPAGRPGTGRVGLAPVRLPGRRRPAFGAGRAVQRTHHARPAAAAWLQPADRGRHRVRPTLAQLRRPTATVKVTTGEPGNVTWFRVDLGAA